MELENLIKQYPELGDVITEMRIDISELQNSTPFYHKQNDKESIKAEELPWSKRQWDYVQQLQARVIHLENKVLEMRSRGKQKRGPKYK